MDEYSTELLQQIAEECSMYESLASAQGFGFSWANFSGDEKPECDNCVHWQDSTCSIFRSELYNTKK